MPKSVVLSYLNYYAEQEVKLLTAFPNLKYQHALVIPAYQESVNFLHQYQTLFVESKLLIIVVINQPESATDESLQQQLSQEISQCHKYWKNEHLALHSLSQHCDVLTVLRFTQELRIPDKFGVGLARKIGADLALALHHQGITESPWIACTDADAVLPNNYFKIIGEQDQNIDALTLDFSHQGEENEILQATKLYEIGLKYYQAGLQWAGSRYAYHAIGSCLVVNAKAYAIHRGIPKRPAGEDFYLLNKIAKRGTIKHLENCQVLLESRLSERTPFGTGTAVNKILANPNQQYNCYQPDCFTALKLLLDQLSHLIAQETYKQWQQSLAKQYRPALDNLGLEKFHRHHMNQGVTQDQLEDDIHCWFDGLKTLQFLHYMRANHYPDMQLEKAVQSACFYGI